jgi:hypothetical protein
MDNVTEMNNFCALMWIEGGDVDSYWQTWVVVAFQPFFYTWILLTPDIYIFVANLIGSDGWVSVFHGIAFPMLLVTAATTNTRNASLKFCPKCKSEMSSDRPQYFSREI